MNYVYMYMGMTTRSYIYIHVYFEKVYYSPNVTHSILYAVRHSPSPSLYTLGTAKHVLIGEPRTYKGIHREQYYSTTVLEHV